MLLFGFMQCTLPLSGIVCSLLLLFLLQVLTHFAQNYSGLDKEEESIKDVLVHIDSEGLLPPMRVIKVRCYVALVLCLEVAFLNTLCKQHPENAMILMPASALCLCDLTKRSHQIVCARSKDWRSRARVPQRDGPFGLMSPTLLAAIRSPCCFHCSQQQVVSCAAFACVCLCLARLCPPIHLRL